MDQGFQLPNLPKTEVKPELLQLLNRNVQSSVVPPPDVDDDQKGWLLVGLMLNAVVNPALRQYVAKKIKRLYSKLVSTYRIKSQTYAYHLTHYPQHPAAGYKLNYEAINNNKPHRGNVSRYNYNVTNVVDFSKLFLKTYMAQYNTFNECNGSALLGLIVNVNSFPQNVQMSAGNVRSQIRNDWAHCNFADWDTLKFQSSMQLMENLIRLLLLPSNDENYYISELNKWKVMGKSCNFFCQRWRHVPHKVHQFYSLKIGIALA